jgi:hypothetical protein
MSIALPRPTGPSIRDIRDIRDTRELGARAARAPRSGGPGRRARAALLLALLLHTACAYQVVPLDETPTGTPPRIEPLPFTVALGISSFEVKQIKEEGFLQDFVGRLKDARIFEGVIFPVPEGFTTLWEVKLLARERASEPNSNLWKSALANALFPLAFFIYLESEYEFELEALLTRKREVIASYPVVGHIRYRYQRNTDRRKLDLEGIQTIVDRTSRQLLAKIVADAERIRAEDQARTGR